MNILLKFPDMKRIHVLTFLLLATFTLHAQRTVINDPNVQGRTVKPFHGVEVSGGIDLYLSQAEEEALAVSASTAGMRDDIQTEVTDGILKISYKAHGKFLTSGNRKLRAYVAFVKLDKLKASGASDVLVTGELHADELTVVLSGASDLKADVHLKKMNLEQSGASDANITGKVTELVVQASGASDLDGYGLESEVCTVKASGASDVKVTVNKELNADASGASSVRHRGKASKTEVKTAGGGRVKA
jgi:hypothetical protein